MNKVKEVFKNSKFTFIMSIITFMVGIYIGLSVLGVPLSKFMIVLLLSLVPCLYYLIILTLDCKYKKNKKTLINIFKYGGLFILPIYYFLILFVALGIAFTNPITDVKYYNHYVNGELNEIFPKKIPKDAEKVSFYYTPGLLQAGTIYSLYYIDKDINSDKINELYKDKAIWIGKISEYEKDKDLLNNAFSFSPLDGAIYEDDYTIYLFEGDCDDSGYCNHGKLLFMAYNDNTKEILYKAEGW